VVMIDGSRALWTISNEGPAASFRKRADNRARALRLRLAPKFRVQCPISEVSTRRVGPVSAYSILVINGSTAPWATSTWRGSGGAAVSLYQAASTSAVQENPALSRPPDARGLRGR
jgi:hypothetical protein